LSSRKKALFLSSLRTPTALLAAKAAALCLLLFSLSCMYFPDRWWYPFPSTFYIGDYYTTGPLGLTSNMREDNPVWSQLPEFNKTLSRLTYAMSRGEAHAQVAWLFSQGEWLDGPALKTNNFYPNINESAMSHSLMENGITYDRVSRRDLSHLALTDNGFAIGNAHYQALVLNTLTAVEPQLLERIVSLAQHGVPIIISGELPTRALGLADAITRDARVAELTAQLKSLNTVTRITHAKLVGSTLRNIGVEPIITPKTASSLLLRINHRKLNGAHLVLLYNETNTSIAEQLTINTPHQSVELLNPENGSSVVLDMTTATINIPPGRTRLLKINDNTLNIVGDEAQWSLDKWQLPPKDYGPYMRWWWPGNAVDDNELITELQSLSAAGYGGVELQTLVAGFSFDYLAQQQDTIYQVGTEAYFSHLKTVFSTAELLHMKVDLTLGSGWPGGGPFIDSAPEKQLLRSSIDVVGPMEINLPLPAPQEPFYAGTSNQVIPKTIGSFDSNAEFLALVAAKVNTATSPPTLSNLTDITFAVNNGNIHWQAPAGTQRIFALYQNKTQHNVVGSAYPGALEKSSVFDHLDRAGINEFITDFGEPLLAGIAPYKPNALFVDSFELIGELPWTPEFKQAFIDMHRYDPTSYLPLMFQKKGESKYVNIVLPATPAFKTAGITAQRVREDYLKVREALFISENIEPLRAWANAKNLPLRLQSQGGYGDYLDVYQYADIPETESLFAGGTHEFLKLASSAARVAGKRFISCESFINLTYNFNALTIDDYYMLAGNLYSAGINLTIAHGYAYHAERQ